MQNLLHLRTKLPKKLTVCQSLHYVRIYVCVVNTSTMGILKLPSDTIEALI